MIIFLSITFLVALLPTQYGHVWFHRGPESTHCAQGNCCSFLPQVDLNTYEMNPPPATHLRNTKPDLTHFPMYDRAQIRTMNSLQCRPLGSAKKSGL